ncbi:MAG: BlaR1 peptidase M56 [Gammaproteobacteria bacterium]|nr:BlaR1 peptidase M56 [Gammaproteobacteria bacterium]
MINYIIQVMLFQILFLAVYDLILSKETFFNKNRWYLLGSAFVSFLIPFIKIPTFQKSISREVSIVLPEIVLSPQSYIEQTDVYQNFNYGSLIFWLGVAVFALLFVVKLYKLIRLILKNTVVNKDGYTLITISNSKKAFSFFNYIFLGETLNEKEKEKIISHELIHSNQKHSIDLLIFESLKIIMWFNPLLYIYQNRISTVHEFISDAAILKTTEKNIYMNKLLNQLFEVENISFVNQFYKSSLIKKRIMMITKEKSKQIKQAKYLLLIPVLASMLFYVSCSENMQLEEEVIAKKQVPTFYGLPKYDYGDTAKETYLHLYFGNKSPNFGEEISLNKLTKEEKNEFHQYKKRLEEGGSKFWSKYVKLYQLETGRKMIAIVWDFSMDSIEEIVETKKYLNGVPFTVLDKVPTFPGCPDNDKKCFNKKMQQHFADNFNSKLPNQLDLKSGKKRLIMLFEIDKQGNVINAKVKAPAPELQKEAIKIINLLPKMTPGEKDGEIVSVKYTLPMRIDVK